MEFRKMVTITLYAKQINKFNSRSVKLYLKIYSL